MHAMRGNSYSPWFGSGLPIDLASSDKQKQERRS
jgi:hypothetical protein